MVATEGICERYTTSERCDSWPERRLMMAQWHSGTEYREVAKCQWKRIRVSLNQPASHVLASYLVVYGCESKEIRLWPDCCMIYNNL